MASKGLRAITYQVTRKVEAGNKPSRTIETLIGYIVCWRYVHFNLSVKVKFFAKYKNIICPIVINLFFKCFKFIYKNNKVRIITWFSIRTYIYFIKIGLKNLKMKIQFLNNSN